MVGMSTRLTHLQRVLGAATAWGVLWSLGALSLFTPIFARVAPRWVLFFGVLGLAVGVVLNGGLVYVFRRKDLTVIGLGGLPLPFQQRATGILHIVGASGIGFLLASARDVGFSTAGFAGHALLFGLVAFPFVLPIWAFFAAVFRLTTKAKGQVLFLLADFVVVPTVFMLWLYLWQAIR